MMPGLVAVLLLCSSPVLADGRAMHITVKQNLRHQQNSTSSEDSVELAQITLAESIEDTMSVKKTKALLEANQQARAELDAELADKTSSDAGAGGLWKRLLPLPGRPYDRERIVADMEALEKEGYTLNVALDQLAAEGTPTDAAIDVTDAAAAKLKARLKYLEDLKRAAPSLVIFQTIFWLFAIVMILFMKGYLPLTTAVAAKEGPVTSLYWRIFLKHKSPVFAADFELAFRGALFALLVGLPFLAYNHPWEEAHTFVREGYYTGLAIVYFIYTLYKSVGETVHFAYCGTIGTFAVVLNAWVLYGFFPVGVSESTEPMVFWIGLTNGTLLVIGLLWLNFELSTVVFALSTWVWFWMDFLEPTPDNFSTGFEIRLRGTAINNLLQCSAGCLIAILATLVPFPIWALDKAKNTSREAEGILRSTWTTYVQAFREGSQGDVKMALVAKSTKGLRASIDSLQGHIDNAWWECFGLGRRQKVRLMLTRLNDSVYESFDILAGTQSALSATVGPKREKMMDRLDSYINAIIEQGSALMAKCTEAALDGEVDKEEARDIRQGMLLVKTAIGTLTQKFEEAKNALGAPKLHEDLIDEHVFCFAVCAYGRIASVFAEDVLADADGTKKFVQSSGGSIFDRALLRSQTHTNFALRNSISILLCFLVGFQGYGSIISPHNAGISGVMALLMSKSVGSAMKQNLGRLQGVVLGTIVGQILYSVFGWCTWWGFLLSCTALFSWAYLTLFLYYNSTNYSFLGVLLAAFGSQQMLQSCAATDFQPDTAYGGIINIIVAIGVMIGVDTIFASKPPSEKAVSYLLKTWELLDDALKQHFSYSSSELVTRFHKRDIMGAIAESAERCDQANAEPRFHRAPWKNALFTVAVRTTRIMRYHTSLMEFSAAEGRRDGAPKHKAFLRVIKVPSMNVITKSLAARFELLTRAVQVFLREPWEIAEGQDSAQLLLDKDSATEQKRNIKMFLDEANKSALFSEQASNIDTMEDDPAVQACVVLASTSVVLQEMDALLKKLLKA